MSAIDITLGFLAGIVSCLTPEALLLLPLMIGATRAADRLSVIAPAVGLGLAVILTGTVAASFGSLFGLEAIWLRRIVSLALIAQGIALMSASLVKRFAFFTGGSGEPIARPGARFPGGALRQMVLALFVGANWIPVPGPTLGKASLMAAGAQNSILAFGILFVFGAGAAMPWIVVGRGIRWFARAASPSLLDGMPGKRLLGFTLLAVAVLGISGLDVSTSQWLARALPPWTHKLAMTF